MFKMGLGQDIGIDLGTATVIVYVKGKGIITPELAVKCFYRYGLHAAESIYQQYPKKDHEPVPLEEKMREFGVDATEMKTAVLQAETLLDRMQEKESK